jgi:hypothetical protein
VFPLQPRDAKNWNAVLVVDFPVELPRSGMDATREFGVVLQRGTDVLHTFNRSISVKANEEDSPGDAPRVTFVEPVTLPPGVYDLTAVLVSPEGTKPFGQVANLTVPRLPKREPILTGPVLGRRRGNDVVVYGGGDAKGLAGDRLGRARRIPAAVDRRGGPQGAAGGVDERLRGASQGEGRPVVDRARTRNGVRRARRFLGRRHIRRAGRHPLAVRELPGRAPRAAAQAGSLHVPGRPGGCGRKLDQKKEGMAPFLVDDPAPAKGDH